MKYVLFAIILGALVAGYFILKKDPAPVTVKGLRYAAIGDSYTIGQGETEANRWPNQLVTKLTNDGTEVTIVTNPSRTGYTTLDLLDKEIQPLKESNPDFVTVQIGVNDYFQGVSAQEFTKRFQEVLTTISQTAPQAKILVVNIPDYGKSPAGAQSGNPEVIEAGLKEYNQIIATEASKRNLPVADVFAISQSSASLQELAPDGLHPSGAQYTKWLKAIYPATKKLL